MLDNLPSTNFKIVVGAVLAVLTALFYFAMSWAGKVVDPVMFGEWLAFVATWAGLAYLTFAKKRDTYVAPSPDSERAGVPSEPPPSEPTPAAQPFILTRESEKGQP